LQVLSFIPDIQIFWPFFLNFWFGDQ